MSTGLVAWRHRVSSKQINKPVKLDELCAARLHELNDNDCLPITICRCRFAINCKRREPHKSLYKFNPPNEAILLRINTCSGLYCALSNENVFCFEELYGKYYQLFDLVRTKLDAVISAVNDQRDGVSGCVHDVCIDWLHAWYPPAEYMSSIAYKSLFIIPTVNKWKQLIFFRLSCTDMKQ